MPSVTIQHFKILPQQTKSKMFYCYLYTYMMLSIIIQTLLDRTEKTKEVFAFSQSGHDSTPVITIYNTVSIAASLDQTARKTSISFSDAFCHDHSSLGGGGGGKGGNCTPASTMHPPSSKHRKCCVLTTVGEIRCCGNDHYHYHYYYYYLISTSLLHTTALFFNSMTACVIGESLCVV